MKKVHVLCSDFVYVYKIEVEHLYIFVVTKVLSRFTYKISGSKTSVRTQVSLDKDI